MGGDGEKAQNVINPKNTSTTLLENRANLSSDPQVAQLLAQYGTGGLSLKDALAQAGGMFGGEHKKYNIDDEQKYIDQGAEGRWTSQIQNQLRDQFMGSADYLNNSAKYGYGSSAPSGESLYQQALAKDPHAFDSQKSQAMGDIRNQLDSEYKKGIDDFNTNLDQTSGGKYNQFVQLLTTDPLAAQRYMTDELQNNSLTSGLFGKGGMQDQVQGEASDLMGQVGKDSQGLKDLEQEIAGGEGFQLRPEDHGAYGVLSGNIARMFGSQENDLANSLASRGLASAPSGAAGQGFSTLLGNKQEQLANAQRQVLQDRVNTAMQQYQMRGNLLNDQAGLDQNRLSGARSTALNLGSLSQTAMSNLFNRNMAARGQTQNELGNAADKTLANQLAYQGQLNTGFNQDQATKGPSLGDVLGGVAMGGLGAAAGGFGGGLGLGAASSMFGGLGGAGASAGGGQVSNFNSVLGNGNYIFR